MDQIGHGEPCCSSRERAQGSPAQGHTRGLCAGGSQHERGSSNLLLVLRVHLKKKQDKDSQSNARRIEILFLFFNKSGECPNQFTFFKSQLNCKDVSEQIGMDPKIKLCQ